MSWQNLWQLHQRLVKTPFTIIGGKEFNSSQHESEKDNKWLEKRLQHDPTAQKALLNSFFHINPKSNNPYQIATLQAYKWLYLYQLLLRVPSLDGFTFSRVEKLLRKWQTLQLWLPLCSLIEAYIQRLVLLGDYKKIDRLTNIQEQAMRTWEREQQLRRFITVLKARLLMHAPLQGYDLAAQKRMVHQGRWYLRSTDSFMLRWQILDLLRISHEMTYNYHALLRTVQQSMKLVKAHPQMSGKQQLHHLLLLKFKATAHLQNKENTLAAFRALKQADDQNPINRFIYPYYLFRWLVYTGQFKRAALLLDEYFEQATQSRISKLVSDKWKVARVIMFILYKMGFHRYMVAKIGQMRLSRFLNQDLMGSREKAGDNALLVVVQFLASHMAGKTSETLDRVDALRSYNNRHLKEHSEKRTYHFVRYLLRLVQLQHTEQLPTRKALETHRQEIDIFGVEFYPYEKLLKRL